MIKFVNFNPNNSELFLSPTALELGTNNYCITLNNKSQKNDKENRKRTDRFFVNH